MTERRINSDITKTSVPLPFMVGIISIALGIAAAVWSIRTDVQLMSLRMEYEAKIREADKESTAQSFKALEAKIDAAGLRNFNMSIMSDLQKAQEKLKGR